MTYIFAVTAYNTAWRESACSRPIVYTAGATRVIALAVLANISTRTLVQTGANVMIGGFIIDGIVPKKVALRGIGPSLTAAGVSGALVDPVLQVLNSGGSVVASNDNWKIPGEEVSDRRVHCWWNCGYEDHCACDWTVLGRGRSR